MSGDPNQTPRPIETARAKDGDRAGTGAGWSDRLTRHITNGGWRHRLRTGAGWFDRLTRHIANGGWRHRLRIGAGWFDRLSRHITNGGWRHRLRIGAGWFDRLTRHITKGGWRHRMGGKVQVAHIFWDRDEHSGVAREAGLEVVYAVGLHGGREAKARDASSSKDNVKDYLKDYMGEGGEGANPGVTAKKGTGATDCDCDWDCDLDLDFRQAPEFDVVLVGLPLPYGRKGECRQGPREKTIRHAVRMVETRRPVVLLMVGVGGGEEEALGQAEREMEGMGYGIDIAGPVSAQGTGGQFFVVGAEGLKGSDGLRAFDGEAVDELSGVREMLAFARDWTGRE